MESCQVHNRSKHDRIRSADSSSPNDLPTARSSAATPDFPSDVAADIIAEVLSPTPSRSSSRLVSVDLVTANFLLFDARKIHNCRK